MVPSPRKLDEGRTYFENLGMEGGIVFLYSKAFTKLAQIFGLRRGPVASFVKGSGISGFLMPYLQFLMDAFDVIFGNSRNRKLFP